MRKFIKNKQIVIGFIMILCIVTIAVLAPFIIPNNPYDVDITNKFASNGNKYPLGTDQLGRCVLSRLMLGATYSISISLVTLLILVAISILIGVTSVFYGGIYDSIISALCNVFMAFPPFAVVLSLSNVLGQGVKNLILSLVISMWVWFVRVIRSYVKVEMKKDYIISSRIVGCSNLKIIIFHLLPNLVPMLLVYFSTSIAALILMISGYAFLGIGFDPNIPEWGAMLSNGKAYLYSSPKMIILPGICILFTATAFNLFGEGLRDIIAPRRV
ncbi:ABC-type dipeptide/oligopeptide/nickel transport system permease subunit [Clostridium tetanomorphum]|nr:ABC transporter permease [Clostridium tetanomorphum]KAJ52859.1 binding-protein-dependent transport system inner membrane protein [Clostridium tetanomorphum DSM 665]MBP1865448.1 ABC-type dipeptide/oligopeptide/nickel transport system permease subunit [Clostridium tetanomorphum]NRS84785.1 ABC-type dipeptide/oligopeptide/nickel transport system permease subunit [Clostridium tetanomorphum]NRZ98003.1 ABC-type dipeptide/oligopeptide/nickel transport system permease subunit [Clostridium tetanomorph